MESPGRLPANDRQLAAIINKDNPDVDRRHGAEPLALSVTRLPPSANPTT
jgi:hypothetical protein